jgi:hypothetical protein
MISIRMSSAGYCKRKLSAMLLGREATSTPKWLSESAEEGNWHEDRLIQELTNLGCEVIDRQLELQTRGEGFQAIGHIDGRIKLSPKLFESPLFTIHYMDCTKADIEFSIFHLLEIKSLSFLEHQRWIAEGFDGYFKYYGSQHTMYRNALSSPLSLLISKDRSGGARNIFIMGKDPVPVLEVMAQLKEVAAAAEQGDLVPMTFNPDNLECRRCSFRTSQCVKEFPKIEEAEMVQASRDYRAGRDQESAGKLLAEQARDIMIAYAKRKGMKKWIAGGWPVSYSSYPRNTISISALDAIMPREQFEAAINTSIVEKITVTNPDKEE